MQTGRSFKCPLKRKAEVLPSPGPDLHCGMFRKRTIEAVQNVKWRLERATDVESIFEALDELGDYVIDAKVLHTTKIFMQVKQIMKKPETDAQVVGKAEALTSRWKKDYEIRKQVIDTFKQKGNLTEEMAKDMEESLFNASSPLGFLEGDGYRSYQRHFKRLCNHLRTKGAGSVSQQLAERQISPQEVAWLPDDQLMSLDQLEKEQAHREEGLQAALATQAEPEGIATEEFVCPKCSSDRTVYTEKTTAWHTDGQDATILVTCLSCNNRWKANDDHGLGG